LIGFRNRLAVAMNWCWNYVTFQRGTRLITGISGSRIEDVMPAVTTAPPWQSALETLARSTFSRLSGTTMSIDSEVHHV
jgi:NADH dehydrogenase